MGLFLRKQKASEADLQRALQEAVRNGSADKDQNLAQVLEDLQAKGNFEAFATIMKARYKQQSLLEKAKVESEAFESNAKDKK